jgi:hypothetical protein
MSAFPLRAHAATRRVRRPRQRHGRTPRARSKRRDARRTSADRRRSASSPAAAGALGGAFASVDSTLRATSLANVLACSPLLYSSAPV